MLLFCSSVLNQTNIYNKKVNGRYKHEMVTEYTFPVSRYAAIRLISLLAYNLKGFWHK